MRIAVTGSIATDYLMSFPGRFTDHLVDEQLEENNLSLSFLADHLEIRKGGVAANIAFGLGQMEMHPILIGAVGPDFAEYREWLEKHNVDTGAVHVSQDQHTSRFLCTSDESQNQIATFYPGAMGEARDIKLKPIVEKSDGLDLVVISPNDPVAMGRYTEECRQHGYPFAADPSQQLARLEGSEMRGLVDGATYLFSNAYETSLLLRGTGWTHEEVLDRVGTWVTTHGEDGVRIESKGAPAITVPALPVESVVEPTGVGDAFRAGFLWGVSKELSIERAAQVGCTLAAQVLEIMGTQEYEVDKKAFSERVAKTYGEDAGAEIAGHL